MSVTPAAGEWFVQVNGGLRRDRWRVVGAGDARAMQILFARRVRAAFRGGVELADPAGRIQGKYSARSRPVAW